MKHKPHSRAVVMLLAVLLMISLLPQPIQAAATRPEIQIGDYIRLGTYEALCGKGQQRPLDALRQGARGFYAV